MTFYACPALTLLPHGVCISVEEVALEREVEGDLFLQDIGQGFGFRPGSFDGAIRSVYPSLQRPQNSLLTSHYHPWPFYAQQHLCNSMAFKR